MSPDTLPGGRYGMPTASFDRYVSTDKMTNAAQKSTSSAFNCSYHWDADRQSAYAWPSQLGRLYDTVIVQEQRTDTVHTHCRRAAAKAKPYCRQFIKPSK